MALAPDLRVVASKPVPPNNIGLLSLAARNAIPGSLLLSISPVNGNPNTLGPKSIGKTPAYWNVGRNNWYLTPGWQQGQNPTSLRTSLEMGGSLGIRLGVPANDMQFVMLDIDTEHGKTDEDLAAAYRIRSLAIEFAEKANGGPVWVRTTKPWRAAILYLVKSTLPAGKKRFINLLDINGQNRGKMEFLATGQYVVIAGENPYIVNNAATPIRWYRTDEPNELHLLPAVDDALPILAEKEGDIESFVAGLTECLLTEPALRIGKVDSGPKSAAVVGDFSVSDLQAPPYAELLVDILRRMPLPPGYEHQHWVEMHFATIGSLRALEAQGRLTQEQHKAVVDAFVDWSAKWRGDTEWTREMAELHYRGEARNPVLLSWRHVLERAADLGVYSPVEAAQVDFKAEGPPPTSEEMTAERVQVMKAVTKTALLQYGTTEDGRRGPRPKNLVQSAMADIIIADAIQAVLQDVAVWVAQEGRWIVWCGKEMGWGNPLGDGFVRNWIEDELLNYVTSLGGSVEPNQWPKLLSTARIDAIEKILKARLAKSVDDIDQGEMVIQTPVGAFRLEDGAMLSWQDQAALVDTRCAQAAPKDMPIPMFDKVMAHMACDNQDIVAWMWAYFGYLLLGKPKEHVLLVIHGPGKNGKSTLHETLLHVFGTYGVMLDRSVLLESGKGSHPTALSDVKGRRLWVATEMEPGEKWHESQLRGMTGGDIIKARRMNRNWFDIRPEGSLLITTNHLPSFHSIDEAVVRRLRIIHSKWVVEEKVNGLKDFIMAKESPGIIHRLMKEARAVYENGFALPPVPAAMQAAANRYLGEQDGFFAWFRKECRLTNSLNDTVPLAELLSRYKMFHARTGDVVGPDGVAMNLVSDAAFMDGLRKQGVDIEDHKGVKLRDASGVQIAQGLVFKVAEVRVSA